MAGICKINKKGGGGEERTYDKKLMYNDSIGKTTDEKKIQKMKGRKLT